MALLTRSHAPEVPRADVLADRDPADVLVAMESIAGGLLLGVWPRDGGTEVLAALGLIAADMEAGAASGR